MKNLITKLFLFAVALLLSFNYIIFPGLTAANTLYNLGALFFAFGVGLYSYNFLSNIFDYFTQKDTKDEFANKEAFQKMAGIIPHETGFIKDTALGRLNTNVVDEIKKEFQNSEFPSQSETIPIKSTIKTKAK